VTASPRLPVAPGGASPRAYAPELAAALDAYQRAVVKLRVLDPVTTELVRLRCASYHDCRRCRSLRSVTAREHGVDEPMVEKVADFERSDLSERHRVALRFADAYLTAPASLAPGLLEQLHAHFTPMEAVELALDVSKWSYQKGLVALELDAVGPGEAKLLDFDEEGGALLLVDERG
jgi:alkylhydroperoxidase family enzyme